MAQDKKPEDSSIPDKPANSEVAEADIPMLRKIIHDLNGELFLIRGYADLAMHNLDDQDLARKNLQKMIHRSNQVATLLMDLRSLVPKK